MRKHHLLKYLKLTANNKRFKDFSNLLNVYSKIEELESDLDNCKWLLQESWKTNRQLERDKRKAELKASKLEIELQKKDIEIQELRKINEKLIDGL